MLSISPATLLKLRLTLCCQTLSTCTVQCFIKIIWRGLTWRVNLLSDIYRWADSCTLQWLRILSPSMSLAFPPRNHHYPSTQLFAVTLLWLFLMETNPAINLICPSAAAQPLLQLTAAWALWPVQGWRRPRRLLWLAQGQGTGSAAWLEPGCIAAGLVLPAKGDMQRAQFPKVKNTIWARGGSTGLDLPFLT